MTNQILDPQYFHDAIEEFAFNYTLYVLTGKTVNAYHDVVQTYTTHTIRGSLQSQGVSLDQRKTGNITKHQYRFFCKSSERINIGDIMHYHNNYLRVNAVIDDYDEYGVRGAELDVIQLADYRDLAEYVHSQTGGQA